MACLKEPMESEIPRKVLLTSGHEIGGLTSFAEALADGFTQLGISAEVIPPARIWTRWRELRDPGILKILSTTAVFAVPFAKRAISVAHGCPCADVQGWPKVVGFLASYKLTNLSRRTPLVAVSEYSAVHLLQIFNLRFEAVIQNPVKQVFLEPYHISNPERRYITYVGRLHPAKNVHRLLPAIRTVLDETPGLRACIIGDGDQLPALRAAYPDERIEFPGSLDSAAVRNKLRATRVFVSGNQTEPFGITYLEALSQGCNVAMPASGGGLEIRPDLIGVQIHLLPISLDCEGVAAGLRRALSSSSNPVPLEGHSVAAVAKAYLKVDAQRSQPARRWISRRIDATGRLDN